MSVLLPELAWNRGDGTATLALAEREAPKMIEAC